MAERSRKRSPHGARRGKKRASKDLTNKQQIVRVNSKDDTVKAKNDELVKIRATKKIIRLNIGSNYFTTSPDTLLSRGENFFSALLREDIPTVKDETGATFIDRNGKYFAIILEYLRHGTVYVPEDGTVDMQMLFGEADFYLIDLVPGMCGDVKEGLYTSQNWIIFLERDQSHPWLFGITGVLQEKPAGQEKKRIFIKEVCQVNKGMINWGDYRIYTKGNTQDVYIWNPKFFGSETKLFLRCPKGDEFPLDIKQEALVSDGCFDNYTSPVMLAFSKSQGKIIVKSHLRCDFENNNNQSKSQYKTIEAIAEVLCRGLVIMHVLNDIEVQEWLLYLHSDVAFFSFNYPKMDFGAPFLKIALTS